MSDKRTEQESYSTGEEILGNLGFWPVVLAILALAASFLLRAQSYWLLPAVFGLLALTQGADAARYFYYRKERGRALRRLGLCVLLIGIAIYSPQLVSLFGLWRI